MHFLGQVEQGLGHQIALMGQVAHVKKTKRLKRKHLRQQIAVVWHCAVIAERNPVVDQAGTDGAFQLDKGAVNAQRPVGSCA